VVNDIRKICDRTADPIERLDRIANEFMEAEGDSPPSAQRFFFEILMQTIMEGGVFFTRKHYIREVHQKFIRTIADIPAGRRIQRPAEAGNCQGR
jgi:hypothetical protein